MADVEAPATASDGIPAGTEDPIALLNKTSLCSFFRKGPCKHQDSCKFAHGEGELRPRPDGSWDPTSDRAKSLQALSGGGARGGHTSHVSVNGDEVTMCLLNSPKGWQSDDVRKLLDALGVKYASVKKRKAMANGFLTFGSSQEADAAQQLVDGHKVQGRQLQLAPARPRAWERAAGGPQKRQEGSVGEEGAEDEGDSGDEDQDRDQGALEGDQANGPEGEDGAASGPGSGSAPVKEVWQAVTPLANISYAQQLEQKKAEIGRALKSIVRKTRKCCPKDQPLPDWVANAREHGGLPCEYLGITPSPVVDGYRNKCEFSVGLSREGDRTVGFQLGMFKDGVTAVAEPLECRNVSPLAQAYAGLLQSVVRASPLPVWDKKGNRGFWRMLMVREGRRAGSADPSEAEKGASAIADVMLTVQVSPLGVAAEAQRAELQRMARAFAEGARAAEPPLPLTVLLVQEHTGVSNAAPPDCPIWRLPLPAGDEGEGGGDARGPARAAEAEGEGEGDEAAARCIHDHMGPLKFRISPTAFFQVNTLAAQQLYAQAGDWAGLGPDTLLFDVCCGTGTIGLTLAHRAAMVVGIEMNAAAVEDAKVNARINGIRNCVFVAAKAEDVMEKLLRQYVAAEAPANGDAASEGEPAAKKLRPGSVPAEEDEEGAGAGGTASCSMAEASLGRGPMEASPEEEEARGKEAEAEVSPRERKYSQVVAIVDPPRSGLHPTVLRTLRSHTRLRRLVYVSCNVASLAANALELCTPLSESKEGRQRGQQRGWKRGRGGGQPDITQTKQRLQNMDFSPPFRLVKAMAVDMFPHTSHCEVVVLFERVSDSNS